MANKWGSYLGGALAGGVMGQFGATAPYAAAGSALTGALLNKKSPLQGAAQGFVGGGAGSTLGGGIKGALTNNGGSVMSNFGGGSMSGLKSYGNSIPGFGGIGTSNPTGMMSKFLTPQSTQNPGSSLATQTKAFGGGTAPNDAGLMIPSTLKYGGAAGAVGDVAPSSPLMGKSIVPATGVTKSGIFGGMNVGQLAAGAGVSGLGGLLTPKVRASDFSSATNPLRDRINNPSAAQKSALDQFQSTLATPNGASAESGLANAKLIADRQRADNIRSLNQQFAAAQPGSDYTNSSAYQDAVAKVNSQADQNYAANAAQMQFQYDTQQQVRKAAAAAALAEMDQAQIQSLADLAKYDVYTIAEQTGMDVASAQQIQNLAAMAGQAIMTNATMGRMV